MRVVRRSRRSSLPWKKSVMIAIVAALVVAGTADARKNSSSDTSSKTSSKKQLKMNGYDFKGPRKDVKAKPDVYQEMYNKFYSNMHGHGSEEWWEDFEEEEFHHHKTVLEELEDEKRHLEEELESLDKLMRILPIHVDYEDLEEVRHEKEHLQDELMRIQQDRRDVEVEILMRNHEWKRQTNKVNEKIKNMWKHADKKPKGACAARGMLFCQTRENELDGKVHTFKSDEFLLRPGMKDDFGEHMAIFLNMPMDADVTCTVLQHAIPQCGDKEKEKELEDELVKEIEEGMEKEKERPQYHKPVGKPICYTTSGKPVLCKYPPTSSPTTPSMPGTIVPKPTTKPWDTPTEDTTKPIDSVKPIDGDDKEGEEKDDAPPSYIMPDEKDGDGDEKMGVPPGEGTDEKVDMPFEEDDLKWQPWLDDDDEEYIFPSDMCFKDNACHENEELLKLILRGWLELDIVSTSDLGVHRNKNPAFIALQIEQDEYSGAEGQDDVIVADGGVDFQCKLHSEMCRRVHLEVWQIAAAGAGAVLTFIALAFWLKNKYRIRARRGVSEALEAASSLGGKYQGGDGGAGTASTASSASTRDPVFYFPEPVKPGQPAYHVATGAPVPPPHQGHPTDTTTRGAQLMAQAQTAKSVTHKVVDIHF